MGRIPRGLFREVSRHGGRQLDHAEDIRVRLRNEAPDSGVVGVADLHVRDQQSNCRCGGGDLRVRRGGSAECCHVHGRKDSAKCRQARPAQQESGERSRDEHDEVLQTKDVYELEHPPEAIEEPEQRRRSDDCDDDHDEQAQGVESCLAQ